jgi:uncharacterized protein YbjT (DUF2867 family)
VNACWIGPPCSPRTSGRFLRLPFSEGRHAPIASADQSRVIAALLLDPEPHDRAVYTLHGPVEQNHYDIARALSSALGRLVHYEPISDEEFASAMLKRGLPERFVQHLSNAAVDYQNGVFAGTNDIVDKVGGRAPLSVEQFVADDRSSFDTSGPYFVPVP